jgi:hypothetical protein
VKVFAPGRLLIRTPPRLGGGRVHDLTEATQAPRSRKKPGQARRKRPSRRKSRKASPPHGLPWNEARKDRFAIAGSTDEDPGPERQSWYQVGPPSMWQRNDQRTPGTPERGQSSEGCAEAPEWQAHPLPFWTSGMREVRVTPSTMHRRRLAAPVTAWQPADTDRIPASNLQRVIEISSRWRHGHQRQVRANPSRTFQPVSDVRIRNKAEPGSK